jgi:hypothetical protein
VKLASVDINALATLVDGFVHDPVKFVSEIVSGWRHDVSIRVAILAQFFALFVC